MALHSGVGSSGIGPGPVDPNDPAFAPDQELTPDPPDLNLMDSILKMFTPETSDERALRFQREAEEEQARRDRLQKIMNDVRQRRQESNQDLFAEEDKPKSPNAFSLERAVTDILSNRNRALTDAEN